MLLLFAVCSCRDASVRKLDALLNRMDTDERTYKELKEVDFPVLVADFRYCDSMFRVLQVNDKQQRTALKLLGAYLQQFEEEYPKMKEQIAYSRLQIANLKDDMRNGLMDDEQIADAMLAETDFADRIHNVAEYFRDRFDKQHEAVGGMRKYIVSKTANR